MQALRHWWVNVILNHMSQIVHVGIKLLIQSPCATHPLPMCIVLQIHAFSLGNVGQSQYSLNGGA